MKQKKILVVEDDSVLRDVLVEKLRKTGYTATGAPDGEVAMEVMRKELPDLVLLDILMPKKDGMQVLEEMSTDPVLKHLPVIVISNSGQPVEIDRARKLGARDFLIKAVFEPNEVLDKVEVLLGKINNMHTEQTNPSSPGSTAAPAPSGAGVQNKVLVVEDDKFLRELLVRKLYSDGFVVESAIDSGGAFEILKRFVPDIILLDLILPGMDGFEILSQIRKDQKLAQVPVIILSNLGQKEDIDRAMALGAADFMIKANFTLDEIVVKVRGILSKK